MFTLLKWVFVNPPGLQARVATVRTGVCCALANMAKSNPRHFYPIPIVPRDYCLGAGHLPALPWEARQTALTPDSAG